MISESNLSTRPTRKCLRCGQSKEGEGEEVQGIFCCRNSNKEVLTSQFLCGECLDDLGIKRK